MTTFTEGTHPGGFLVWEAHRDYTRETIIVASGPAGRNPGVSQSNFCGFQC